MSGDSGVDVTVVQHELSRRGLLRAGGITVGLAALVSACADDVHEDAPSRVGSVPPTSTLPPAVVTDGVLFRTASSMHYSTIDAHNFAIDNGDLTAEQRALVETFIAANQAAIATLDEWTVRAGSQVWGCANPRFNRMTLDPIELHITGVPDEADPDRSIPPSDDPNRDAMALVYSMETLMGATHQSFVPIMSKPEYRQALMDVGQGAARRSAVGALAINPKNLFNPTSVINANPTVTVVTAPATTTTVQDIAQPDNGATTTTVPTISAPLVYYAVPGQFGLLSPVQLAVGYPNAGTQYTVNMETPSFNSFTYDYQSCDSEA